MGILWPMCYRIHILYSVYTEPLPYTTLGGALTQPTFGPVLHHGTRQGLGADGH